MCRHLAYLGEPVALAELLHDPPHSLAHQSWAPADMRGGGTINADGFGTGWYVDDADPAGTPSAEPAEPGGGEPVGPRSAEPVGPRSGVPVGQRNAEPVGPRGGGPMAVRYRRTVPIWGDPGFAALARVTRAGGMLAAVRSATPGMALTEAACAPFGDGPWLFSHNGVVLGWPDSVAKLAGRLPVADLLTLEAPTDSALLFALVRDRLRAGAEPGEAVAGTVAEVLAAAPGSRLNLLLTDGTTIVATTCGHSLSVRRSPAGTLVASEPLDGDPGWSAVPDRRLVVATRTTVNLGEL